MRENEGQSMKACKHSKRREEKRIKKTPRRELEGISLTVFAVYTLPQRDDGDDGVRGYQPSQPPAVSLEVKRADEIF
jgi:hypothetical protein